MTRTTCLALCLIVVGGSAQADEVIFSEDFNDMRFDWKKAFSGFQPTYSASSGDLVITQESPGASAGTIVWPASTADVLDSSTRVQVSLGGSGAVGIMARGNDSDLTWIHSGFRADMQALYLGWNNLSGYTDFLDPVEFHHDFTEGSDLIIQLDVFDDDYHLSAWPAGELPPSEPQIAFTNDDQIDLAAGGPALGIVVDENQRGSITTGTFRHLVVADQPLVFGDLNADGNVNAQDIDALSTRIRSNGDYNFVFDMNGDHDVNEADRTFWVAELHNTYIGDSNLDGEFDSTDLVTVFQSGKYEQDLNAGWSEGDWSGDDRFDSRDFVIAFRDGGYEKGRREGKAVPEPGSSMGSLFLVFALIIRGYRQFRPTLD